MRTEGVRVWVACFAVIANGAFELGCESRQLLGEPCARDNECVEGAVCSGGKCARQLDLGRDPAQPGSPDAAPDVVQDGAPDSGPDAEPESGLDAETGVEPDARPDATTDAPEYDVNASG